VVSFDERRLTDMYILREAIEVQIVRILCFTIGSEEAEALRSLAVKIDSMAGQSGKAPDYDNLHYQFHIHLAKTTGSKNLLDGMENIHLFSLLSKAETIYTTLENSVPSNEYSHEDIIKAILKRNPEDAERIVRRHVYRSNIIPAPYWI
jgi:DNA-binding GntR family transcriptional regulator